MTDKTYNGVPFYDVEIHRADELVNALAAGAVGFRHGRDNLDLDQIGYVDFRAVGLDGSVHGMLTLDMAEVLRAELDGAIADAHMAHNRSDFAERPDASFALGVLAADGEVSTTDAANALQNIAAIPCWLREDREALRDTLFEHARTGTAITLDPSATDRLWQVLDALYPSK